MVNVNGLLRSVAPLVVNTSCSVMCTVLRLPSAEVISNPRWCDTTVIEKPQTSETSKGAIVSSKDSLTGLSAYAGAAAVERRREWVDVRRIQPRGVVLAVDSGVGCVGSACSRTRP